MEENQCQYPQESPTQPEGQSGPAKKTHRTIAQIAQLFGIHPTEVGGWK